MKILNYTKRELNEKEVKAISAIHHIGPTAKDKRELEKKLDEIELNGINEEDRIYLSEFIDKYRNQVINADLHIMNLEVVQRKEPLSMSNIYYMIALFEIRKESEPMNLDVMVDMANSMFGFDVRRRSRKKLLIIARFLTMKWIRERSKFSYKEIGKALGNFDHSSTIHAISAISDRIPYESEVSKYWNKLSKL